MSVEVFITEDFILRVENTLKKSLASLGLAGALSFASGESPKVKVSHDLKRVSPTSTQTSVVSKKSTNSVDNIIAATLVDEAKGESEEGMHAVLNVILNRCNNKVDAAAKICLAPKQFSGWNSVDKTNAKEVRTFIESKKKSPQFNVALNLIRKARKSDFVDITNGATHFLNTDTVSNLPNWYDKDKVTKKIGNHTFLKL